MNLQKLYAVGSTRSLKTRLGAETLTALDLGIQLMTAPSTRSALNPPTSSILVEHALLREFDEKNIAESLMESEFGQLDHH